MSNISWLVYVWLIWYFLWSFTRVSCNVSPLLRSHHTCHMFTSCLPKHWLNFCAVKFSSRHWLNFCWIDMIFASNHYQGELYCVFLHFRLDVCLLLVCQSWSICVQWTHFLLILTSNNISTFLLPVLYTVSKSAVW